MTSEEEKYLGFTVLSNCGCASHRWSSSPEGRLPTASLSVFTAVCKRLPRYGRTTEFDFVLKTRFKKLLKV